MKIPNPSRNSVVAALLLTAAMPWMVTAFPPAPNHILYGMIRDPLGNPIMDTTALVILETGSGTNTVARIQPQVEAGANYRLAIPLDSGMTADPYKPSALLPGAPFRLKVKIAGIRYLPMEMSGTLARIGSPGERTRVELTLGADADGDGLPDAWEVAAMAAQGRVWHPGDIRPGDPYPGTGLSYHAVYIAGTYAYAPAEGFVLDIVRLDSNGAELEFTAVKGRTYKVMGASELGAWVTVPFTVKSSSSAAAAISFLASSTEKVRVEVPLDADGAPCRFYRLMVE